MKGREFGFSRLLLLLSGIFGLWAFFRPFYQIEFFYARPSGFDISQQLFKYFNAETYGLTSDLLTNELVNELGQQPSFYIPVFVLLIIPLIFGLIAIELLIRSLWLRTNVVHRVWVFLVLSFIGIIAGYVISEQQDYFEFQFFSSVNNGYWKALTMTVFSMFAKFTD